MTGVYSPTLAALACLVAAGGFFIVPQIAAHIGRAVYGTRRYWLLGGGFAVGTALWSSSFIGMLAYHLPIPIAYARGTIVSSWFLAVLVSALTLYTASRATLRRQTFAWLSVLIGAGLATMQYTGMAAMQVSPAISYAPLTVAAALLSFLCVGALTIASLRAPAAATFAHAPWIRAGAAAVIGAAFALATSLAFRSAELSPIARSVAHSRQVTEAWMAVYVLDSDLFRFMVDEVTSAWDASLAVAIAACAAVLLVATQLILMFDAQLVARTARLAQTNEQLVTEVREKQQAERALRSSVEELRVLGSIGQLVNSTLNLQTVLSTIITQAVRLSGADAGTIYEYDEHDKSFVPRANFGVSEMMIAELRDARIRMGETIIGQCGLQRAPVQVVDVELETDYRLHDLLSREGIRALMAVPLLREERTIGAMAIRRKAAGAFSQGDVDLLQTFAAQSVLAIVNARQYQEIHDKGLQLEAASQHKSEFLANMSHELRTPLNAVIGFSEVLQQRMFGELTDKQGEYVDDINSSGQHLLSLINDILDLSKVQAGRMELDVSTFSVPLAIDNALTLIKERAGRHGIELESAIDPAVGDINADERKMKQILLNLLSNAVKFTPDRGKISVTAKAIENGVEVSVADTGIGIAPADCAAVFEEFRQVGQQSDAKAEGTGLGLALARKFVELHGGKIGVTSELGKGSKFTFSLLNCLPQQSASV